MAVTHVKKRDGSVVFFVKSKIANAIYKSFVDTGEGDYENAQKLAEQVSNIVNERFIRGVPSVEDIQNAVEDVLVKNGYAETAKAYILYRQKRNDLRETKKMLGLSDELKLNVNGAYVLEKRYLLKDKTGKTIETAAQMFMRVAKAVASADEIYGESKDEIKQTEKEFYNAMARFEFLPNSPTLMNAGTNLGQLSSCFVLPVEDSLKSILKAVGDAAFIQQSGGGVGFSFSRIRSRGSIVESTRGAASGPISFMRIFDVMTDVVRQGGKRRGAMMGVLRVDHPDIVEFITAKGIEGFLTSFNLSVGITDKFMQALEKDDEFDLVDPKTKKAVKSVRAKDVWNLIVSMAWRAGDPGILFLDEINRHNTLPDEGQIESTNPCGEQPLFPYESCNLGSINLAKMVDGNEIDWKKFAGVVHTAVHFLDNVIDVTKFPLPEIERITKSNRKIGLGVMGFADMLIQLGIPYDSQKALDLAEKIMKFIQDEAMRKSVSIAESRGPFPNFKHSTLADHHKMIRNATLTTIAPTGSLSIIAGCSSGIEPLFAVSFVRNVLEGTKMIEINPYFEHAAREGGFYSEELMAKIARHGSVHNVDEVMYDVKKIFVTSFDIDPDWHVRMQAAFQKHVDNAVSKTINFSSDVPMDAIERAFLLAYKLKTKGITAYRYGSKKEQVLYIGSQLRERPQLDYVSADSEYAGGCPHAGYCGG